MIRKTIKLIAVAWVSALAMGFNGAFGLSLSHETVIPSELVQYVIPRFSLKTRIRFDLVESAGDIQLVTGRPETGAEVLKLVSGETVYILLSAEPSKVLIIGRLLTGLSVSRVGQRLLTLSWMVSRSRFRWPPMKLLRLRWS